MWLAWCYKMVYINIRSIDYLWKFLMEIVDHLYLFDCFIFS